MPVASRSFSVEEFHGPYGPYQVSELVLQKVWLEGAFDASKLVDQEGRHVEVEFPGQWNRLDGPDFKGARLRIDGQPLRGDVEIHFSQSDWKSHGHDGDPNYNDVVLHVVYHRLEDAERPAMKASGEAIPCVALLPLLWYSLEEYASDDSIIASTGVDLRPEVERLLQLDSDSRRTFLIEEARKRWELKLHFAKKRIERLGWEGACHQSALEIMGYSKNRLPMLNVAQRFPLGSLRAGDVSVEALWQAGGERWRLSGSRPANHPKLRLEQYLAWTRARPDWPQSLLALADASLFSSTPLRDAAANVCFGSLLARRELGIPNIQQAVGEQLLAGKIVGSKADTLVCDGLLPLLAVEGNRELFELWFHWPAGNGPESCTQALKQLQILEPRRVPLSNGWLQGMLGLRS